MFLNIRFLISGKYICDADAVLQLRYGQSPSQLKWKASHQNRLKDVKNKFNISNNPSIVQVSLRKTISQCSNFRAIAASSDCCDKKEGYYGGETDSNITDVDEDNNKSSSSSETVWCEAEWDTWCHSRAAVIGDTSATLTIISAAGVEALDEDASDTVTDDDVAAWQYARMEDDMVTVDGMSIGDCYSSNIKADETEGYCYSSSINAEESESRLGTIMENECWNDEGLLVHNDANRNGNGKVVKCDKKVLVTTVCGEEVSSNSGSDAVNEGSRVYAVKGEPEKLSVSNREAGSSSGWPTDRSVLAVDGGDQWGEGVTGSDTGGASDPGADTDGGHTSGYQTCTSDAGDQRNNKLWEDEI